MGQRREGEEGKREGRGSGGGRWRGVGASAEGVMTRWRALDGLRVSAGV